VFYRWCHIALALALLLIIPAVSFASKIIYKTENPFDGEFGLWGYDISQNQSAALRFTPEENVTLNQLSMWFMNNDWSGETHGTVTITLHEDQSVGDGKSIPSDNILESWTIQTTADGWDPQQESIVSQVKPVLQAGRNYWVTASSSDAPHYNAVWCIARFGVGYMSNTQRDHSWVPIGNDQTGAIASITIEADDSSTTPVVK